MKARIMTENNRKRYSWSPLDFLQELSGILQSYFDMLPNTDKEFLKSRFPKSYEYIRKLSAALEEEFEWAEDLDKEYSEFRDNF